MKMDKVDLEILRILSEDGRASYRAISEETGITAGTVRNRINHMRSAGLLHFNLWVDPDLLGLEVHAVLMLNIKSGQSEAAIRALVELEETVYVAKVTGVYDVIVEVVCKDLPHLLRTIDEKVHGIEEVSEVSMSLIVESHRKPGLTALEADQTPGP